MKDSTKGIIIGGLMPAIMLGLFSIFQKIGAQQGVGPELYIVIGGATIGVAGFIVSKFVKSGGFTPRGTAWGLISGACWAFATAAVSYAVFNYDTPMSKLSPIFNTNTLTTMILGMILLGEWKELHIGKAFLGAVMIIVGAMIVTMDDLWLSITGLFG